MISYDRLWKTLIGKHMNKTELGKNEPVNLKLNESICRELECCAEDVLEIRS